MPSLEFSNEVLRVVEQYVNEHVYTAMPAKVIGVDDYESKQIIDIQPQISNIFNNDVEVVVPPVLGVPVVFPSGGGGLLSFPISVGDTVYAVFAQKSIKEWMESRAEGENYRPEDKRSYNINDAVAIPGLYTRKTTLNPNPRDVELKFKNNSIILSSDNVITTTNGESTVEQNGAVITLSNDSGSLALQEDGSVLHGSGAEITADGDFVTADGVSLNEHNHNYVNPDTPSPTQPGVTEPPNVAP